MQTLTKSISYFENKNLINNAQNNNNANPIEAIRSQKLDKIIQDNEQFESLRATYKDLPTADLINKLRQLYEKKKINILLFEQASLALMKDVYTEVSQLKAAFTNNNFEDAKQPINVTKNSLLKKFLFGSGIFIFSIGWLAEGFNGAGEILTAFGADAHTVGIVGFSLAILNGFLIYNLEGRALKKALNINTNEEAEEISNSIMEEMHIANEIKKTLSETINQRMWLQCELDEVTALMDKLKAFNTEIDKKKEQLLNPQQSKLMKVAKTILPVMGGFLYGSGFAFGVKSAIIYATSHLGVIVAGTLASGLGWGVLGLAILAGIAYWKLQHDKYSKKQSPLQKKLVEFNPIANIQELENLKTVLSVPLTLSSKVAELEITRKVDDCSSTPKVAQLEIIRTPPASTHISNLLEWSIFKTAQEESSINEEGHPRKDINLSHRAQMI